MRLSLRLVPAALLAAAFALSLSSMRVAAAEEGEAKSAAAPKTVEVTGVVEAVRAHEITADTEQLGSLKIKRLLDHGVEVSEGQSLVWFETEDIDKKIDDAKIALRLSRLSLDAAEFAHEQAIAKDAIERGKAERALEDAQRAFENFMSVDRERQIASAEFDVTNARASLENVTEELEQLEQMYNEDDLTEESEEIVLKRAKQAVESAQFRLEGVEIASERAITQRIPNSVADQEDTLALAEMTHEKAMRDFDAAAERREIEINKTREAFHDEEEKLAELIEERQRAVLASPSDGIVLHGPLSRGRIGDKPSQLDVGSAVAGNQVVMTVVEPRRLQVRADLNETQLASIHAGDLCTVSFPGVPGLEAKGEVKSVGIVPYAGTKYDCVVKLLGVKKATELKPLMSCKLVFELESDEDDDEEEEEEEEEDDDEDDDDEKEDDDDAAE